MRLSKRTFLLLFVVTITVFLSFSLKLPYYIYKPGHVEELSSMIEMDESFASEGEIYLVTVSGAQATPIDLIKGQLNEYMEVLPIEAVRPDNMSDEEYMDYQLHLMENSHDAAKVVAYTEAGKDVTKTTKGIVVFDVIKGMPAEGIMERGDLIKEVDGKQITTPEKLIEYVQTKKVGEKVTFSIERKGDELLKEIPLTIFPNDSSKKGIGVQLILDQKIEVNPAAEIKSGNIGGPSAGLMFALQLFNQLTEQDITKGYRIAGSGELDVEGNVYQIGGIDKKVVAAHRKGIDLFFVPKGEGKEHSNYPLAKKTAEELNSPMRIIQVSTFTEMIHYLESIEQKLPN